MYWTTGSLVSAGRRINFVVVLGRLGRQPGHRLTGAYQLSIINVNRTRRGSEMAYQSFVLVVLRR